MGFTVSKASDILKSTITSEHYVGLSTTVPNETGDNFTEPSGSAGYARSKIGTLNTSIGGQVANNEIIFFNETLSSWGTILYFGLFDRQSGGKPYLYGALTEPVTITVAGDTYIPIFRAKQLIVGLDKDELQSY